MQGFGAILRPDALNQEDGPEALPVDLDIGADGSSIRQESRLSRLPLMARAYFGGFRVLFIQAVAESLGKFRYQGWIRSRDIRGFFVG